MKAVGRQPVAVGQTGPRPSIVSRGFGWAIAVALLCVACGGTPRVPADAPAPAADPTDPLRVELVEVVRVSRDVVEVRLAFTNQGTRPLDVGPRFAQREADAAAVSGLILVETAARKKLFVLRDAGDRPLCSTGLTPLAPGDRRTVWARFPAPGSATVAVELPGLPPLAPVAVPPPDSP